jgi:hypothetical protein
MSSYKSYCGLDVGRSQQGGYMVAGKGYTPPEHVIEQADLSALRGIYGRYKNKSFHLMVEAVYEIGGEEAVFDFIASVGCARRSHT